MLHDKNFFNSIGEIVLPNNKCLCEAQVFFENIIAVLIYLSCISVVVPYWIYFVS